MALDIGRLWSEAAHLADRHDQWPRQLKTALHTLGQHPRRQPGQGHDFWQYRTLSAGESAARIDWRKSSRGDSLLVREQERAVPARLAIWCDQSASMHYRSAKNGQTKAEWAYVCSATFAILADAAGEQVTTFFQGASLNSLSHVKLRLADRLQVPLPSFLPARSLVLIVSDFLGHADWLSEMTSTALVRQSRVIAIQVHDPAEAHFPFTGRVAFAGLEGEAARDVDDALAARAAYLQAWNDFQNRLKKISELSEHIYISSPTDVPLSDMIGTVFAQLDAY
jgi:uncharacterized protein (DUF58 family)